MMARRSDVRRDGEPGASPVREPLFDGYQTLPVVSSSQWAGTVPRTYQLTGTTDLLMVAGGGIHAHPDGAAAGVASIRQA